MIRTHFLLNLFFVFALMACGHSSAVVDGPVEEPPSQTSTNTEGSENQTAFDWRKARQSAAAGTNATGNTATPATPPATGTLQESDPENPLDAFIQQFVSFNPGPGSKFGQESMDEWLLGPPFGGGQYVQSGDVVSLGNGGEIILSFPRFFPIDGSGYDFIVFENAFQPRGSDMLYVEPGIVGVSQDGEHFRDFPCDLISPHQGCAGTHTIFANPDLNSINPRDPDTAGGDAYDLRQLGFSYARFIRIRDANLNLGGDSAAQSGQAGFDLDAIAIVHGAKQQ